eukprot:CAMPEP_0198302960 /NCGR_PEP_ID=MMETSP1449-20131203/56640_1 /TAXON_ID=420275 /ORGANISM="Attheya septentrionalis, Strain CCMP2084" /LENGTH=1127 /DNA_ID=CAMNT_0044005439 /DNA_START=333 /DNA_END=3717 /DNA_ORIENTATION=+
MTSSKKQIVGVKAPASETCQAGAIGLVRVAHSNTYDAGYVATDCKDVVEVYEGAIMGRNISLEPAILGGKLPLGISPDVGCVSRRQLIVESVSYQDNPTIVVRVHLSAQNPVRIVKLAPVPEGIKRTTRFLSRGERETLTLGDMIEFDVVNSSKEPSQVFRLVRKEKNSSPPVPAMATPRESSIAQGSSLPKSDTKIPAKTSVSSKTTTTSSVTRTQLPSVTKAEPENKCVDRTKQSAAIVTPRQSCNLPTSSPLTKKSNGKSVRSCTVRVTNREKEVKEAYDSSKSPCKDLSKSQLPPVIESVPTEKIAEQENEGEKSQVKPKDAKVKASPDAPLGHCRDSCAGVESEPSNSLWISPLAPKGTERDKKQSAVLNTPIDRHEAGDNKATTIVNSNISVGERFQCLFEMDDGFGRVSSNWYFGTSTKVEPKPSTPSSTKQSWEVSLKFDDGEEYQDEFPGPEICRLAEGRPGSHKGHVIAEEGTGKFFVSGDNDQVLNSSCSQLAYDANPMHLIVGDLVECLYQKGESPGFEGQWYRGRITSINSDHTQCDIHYVEGIRETNVPIGEGYIRLVERGLFDSDWLKGLPIRFKMKTDLPTGDVFKCAVIVDSFRHPAHCHSKSCLLCHSGEMEDLIQFRVCFGKKPYEMHSARSYREIISALFSNMDDKKVNIMCWPDNTQNESEHNLATQSSAKISRKRKEVKSKTSETSNNRKKGRFEVSDSDSVGEDFVPPSSLIDVNRNIVSPWSTGDNNSNCSDSFLEMTEKAQKLPKMLHSSLLNSLGRALNSTEPHVGADLLTHMFVVHNKVPTDSLKEGLLDLLKHGPKCEGTAFYDPNRMELATRCTQKLISSDQSFGPISWHGLELLLSMSINEGAILPSNLSTPDALSKTSCALQFLSHLLSHQLKDVMKSAGDLPGRSGNTYDSGSIANGLVRQSSGVRGALKMVTMFNAKCWIRHGQWVLNPFDSSSPGDLYLTRDLRNVAELKPTGALNYEEGIALDDDRCAFIIRDKFHLRNRCRAETNRCLESFGVITSLVAWIFCYEEGIALDDDRCAFIIRDEFLKQLEQDKKELQIYSNTKKITAKQQAEVKKDLVLSFVLSLNSSSTVVPICNNVAKMLNISEEFELCAQ